MTIWRPSMAAGTTGQQSTSGRVATIMPPECWERWRGRPCASSASAPSQLPAALGLAAGPQRGGDVAIDVLPVPALRAARDALDLPRRQAQRLAQLADGAARAEGREGGHERGAIAPEAVVHARDEDLAHVAREVEVDVGQRRDLLVEEAPEQQLVGDRVDVREAREVADDRGHRRPAPAPGRQQRARRCRVPRTSTATSRASSSISRCSRKKPDSPSLAIRRSSSSRRAAASARSFEPIG